MKTLLTSSLIFLVGSLWAQTIRTGAEQTEVYLPILQDKMVGLVVNQTSVGAEEHLVDVLLNNDIQVVKIFAPEHGFRGKADAGEKVDDSVDPATGIPIVSLYGSKRGPSIEDLDGLDLLIFDIQDVGVRFYTYISTLHYVMEACAKSGVSLLVLDRPNPNGHIVDGPILDVDYRSFVGMHPIPIAHGMTIGEYARMINGENWLGTDLKASLQVIPCKGYQRDKAYQLPIKPSPNLPDMKSIYCYPYTCLFEGTVLSEGRGTPTPFQIFGHPDITGENRVTFVPKSNEGSKYPKLEGLSCRGKSLSSQTEESLRAVGKIDLSHLLEMFHHFPDRDHFFLENGFFDKLAGGSHLRTQIQNGWTEEQIRASWQEGLSVFRKLREKYLLYP